MTKAVMQLEEISHKLDSIIELLTRIEYRLLFRIELKADPRTQEQKQAVRDGLGIQKLTP